MTRQVTITHGKLRVVPDVHFSGRLQFDYSVLANGLDAGATVTIDVRPVADLSTHVTATSSNVYTGDSFSVYATAHNNGPGDATDARVVVDGDGAQITHATTPGGSCSAHGGSAYCSVPDLAVGGSATVTVTAHVTSAGSLHVRTSATSDALDDAHGNDTSAVTVQAKASPDDVVPPPPTPTTPPTTPPVGPPPTVPPVGPPPTVPPVGHPPSGGGGHRSGGGGSIVDLPTTTTTTGSASSTTTTTTDGSATTTTTTTTVGDGDGTATTSPAAGAGEHDE